MGRLSTVAVSIFAAVALAAPQSETDLGFGITSTGAASSVQATSVPSGPVITITIPGGLNDNQYVGSMIGVTSGLTTVAFHAHDDAFCFTSLAPGCTSKPDLTVTAGPTTIHYRDETDGDFTVDVACQFSAGGGSCVNQQTGEASVFVTDTAARAAATGTSSSTSSTAFGADYLSTARITITAGDTAGITAAATATASGGSSENPFTFGPSSSSSPSSPNGGAAAASTTGSTNDVKALAPGAMTAGLMGLLALLL